MNTINETTLASELGITTADLANALRGKTYIPLTQATPIDNQYYKDEPPTEFNNRWLRRVKLTFDPMRSVLFSRAGTSDKELNALFATKDTTSSRDKVNGVKWLSDIEWKALFNAIRAYNNKDLLSRLVIAEDQYRLNPEYCIKKSAKDKFADGE